MTMTNTEVQNLLDDVDDASQARAHLSAAAITTITTGGAGNWDPVLGTFVNDFTNFELDTDKIKYIGTETYEFEVDMHAKYATDKTGETTNITIKHDGVACENCKMGAFAKTAGEAVNISTTHIVTLETNDTLQIVVQSGTTGAEITFGQFVLTCTKYTIPRK